MAAPVVPLGGAGTGSFLMTAAAVPRADYAQRPSLVLPRVAPAGTPGLSVKAAKKFARDVLAGVVDPDVVVAASGPRKNADRMRLGTSATDGGDPTRRDASTKLQLDEYEELKVRMREEHYEWTTKDARAKRAKLLAEAKALRYHAALHRIQHWWKTWWPAEKERRARAAWVPPPHVAHRAASLIQMAWRNYRSQPTYKPPHLKPALHKIGGLVKWYRGSKDAAAKAANDAALKIQAAWRVYDARRVLRALREQHWRDAMGAKFAVRLQAMWRRHVVQKEFKSLRVRNLAALQIQRMFKGWISRIKQRQMAELTSYPADERAALAIKWAESIHKQYLASHRDVLRRQQDIQSGEARLTGVQRDILRSETRLKKAELALLHGERGYAFHKALAADSARLRKIALAIFHDVRTAEEQYRLSVPTKNQWFKDAFDAEGAKDLNMSNKLELTGMLGELFDKVKNRITSRSNVDSITRAMALDLRLSLAGRTPALQKLRDEHEAAVRGLKSHHDRIRYGKKHIEIMQVEAKRRLKGVHYLQEQLEDLLRRIQEWDAHANAEAAMMYGLGMGPDSPFAPQVAVPRTLRLKDTASRKAARERQRLALMDGTSAAGGATAGGSAASTLTETVATGLARAPVAPSPLEKEAEFQRRVAIEKYAIKQRVAMYNMMKDAAAPAVASISVAHEVRKRLVRSVEAEVTEEVAAGLLGPLKTEGPLAEDLGVFPNPIVNLHSKLAKRYLEDKAEEKARDEAMAKWRGGGPPPAESEAKPFYSHKALRREQNLSALLRHADKARVAPAHVRRMFSAAPEDIAAGYADKRSVVGSVGEQSVLLGEGGAGGGSPGGSPAKGGDKGGSSAFDFIDPIGIDIPLPGAPYRPEPKNSMSMLPMTKAMAMLAPPRPPMEIKDTAPDIAPDDDTGFLVAPIITRDETGHVPPNLEKSFPGRPSLTNTYQAAKAAMPTRKDRTSALVALAMKGDISMRPGSSALQSVVREIKGYQSKLAEHNATVTQARDAREARKVAVELVDPPEEVLPSHIRDRVEFEERVPFKGPVEHEADLAAEAQRVAESYKFPRDILKYTLEDMGWWLAKIGMNQYRAAFTGAGIDGETFLQLRPEDVVRIVGVVDRVHANYILSERERALRESAVAAFNALGSTLGEVMERKTERVATVQQNAVPVFGATRAGKVKFVEDAVKYGFDLETEDEDGNTLLMIAVQHGHKRIVDMLAIRGADVNHQNQDGNTSLHYCYDAGTKRLADPDGAIARFLLQHGAHGEICNKHGLPPKEGLRPGSVMGTYRVTGSIPAAMLAAHAARPTPRRGLASAGSTVVTGGAGTGTPGTATGGGASAATTPAVGARAIGISAATPPGSARRMVGAAATTPGSGRPGTASSVATGRSGFGGRPVIRSPGTAADASSARSRFVVGPVVGAS